MKTCLNLGYFSYIKGAVVGGIHVKGSVDLPSRTLLKVNTKTSTMKSEIWKDVVGYEGYYMVSSLGRLKSVDRTVHHKPCAVRPNGRSVLYKSKPINGKCEEGYIRVTLSKSGSYKSHRLHRIVAITFIENPENLPEINHINGIKDDNRVENLEWCTHSENAKHSFQIGAQCNKGENHPMNKLTKENIINIRRLIVTGSCISDVAKEYSVTYQNIWRIHKRLAWKHI